MLIFQSEMFSMKFKINRDHFSSGLQLVTSVVGARKTMPILQNVLIEAKEGLVRLTTTNLDLGARCSVKAEVMEEGSVTLPVKEMGRIVRELADIEVSVETSDTANRRFLHWGTEYFSNNTAANKRDGFSVRLVKD